MEEKFETKHVAGIIPLSGFKSDLNSLPIHPCLNFIGENYLAIERSLVECANAGCKTVWVVVDDDWQPIIRKRLGEFIPDPVSLSKGLYTRYPSEHYKYIPIFYTPIHPRDRDKRDSFAWSMLHGCLTSFIASSKISKWAQPDKYYISSPYGVYDPEVKGLRKAVRTSENITLTSIGSNLSPLGHSGFTLTPELYKEVVRSAKMNRGTFASYRDLSVEELFSPLLEKNLDFLDVGCYYDISKWENYKTFLKSDLFHGLVRPKILQWRDKNE